MERLAKLFAEWSPHDWIDRWATHQRHLTYGWLLPTRVPCQAASFARLLPPPYHMHTIPHNPSLSPFPLG